MKRVIVACNSGVATSQTIVSNLENMLEEKGVDTSNVEFIAIDNRQTEYYLPSADVFVYTIRPDIEINIPTIDGVKFLVGVGAEDELERLIELIKD